MSCSSMLLLWFLAVSITTVTSQLPNLQNLKVPPGSKVEVEVEIEPPPPGQVATPTSKQSNQSNTRPSQNGQQLAGMQQVQAISGQQTTGMTHMQTLSGQQTGPATSPLNQLLSNMALMAYHLRSMSLSLPKMEEPCPCEADCCQMPFEPRRLLPVLHIPMTSHPGCCGCVDCPLSFQPMVSYAVRYAKMLSMRNAGVHGFAPSMHPP